MRRHRVVYTLSVHMMSLNVLLRFYHLSFFNNFLKFFLSKSVMSLLNELHFSNVFFILLHRFFMFIFLSLISDFLNHFFDIRKWNLLKPYFISMTWIIFRYSFIFIMNKKGEMKSFKLFLINFWIVKFHIFI